METNYVSGQGKILKSVDNGISWDEIAHSTGDIHDIHFTTQKLVMPLGVGIIPVAILVVHSTLSIAQITEVFPGMVMAILKMLA